MCSLSPADVASGEPDYDWYAPPPFLFDTRAKAQEDRTCFDPSTCIKMLMGDGVRLLVVSGLNDDFCTQAAASWTALFNSSP